jgi:hypothetical protein
MLIKAQVGKPESEKEEKDQEQNLAIGMIGTIVTSAFLGLGILIIFVIPLGKLQMEKMHWRDKHGRRVKGKPKFGTDRTKGGALNPFSAVDAAKNQFAHAQGALAKGAAGVVGKFDGLEKYSNRPAQPKYVPGHQKSEYHRTKRELQELDGVDFDNLDGEGAYNGSFDPDDPHGPRYEDHDNLGPPRNPSLKDPAKSHNGGIVAGYRISQSQEGTGGRYKWRGEKGEEVLRANQRRLFSPKGIKPDARRHAEFENHIQILAIEDGRADGSAMDMSMTGYKTAPAYASQIDHGFDRTTGFDQSFGSQGPGGFGRSGGPGGSSGEYPPFAGMPPPGMFPPSPAGTQFDADGYPIYTQDNPPPLPPGGRPGSAGGRFSGGMDGFGGGGGRVVTPGDYNNFLRSNYINGDPMRPSSGVGTRLASRPGSRQSGIGKRDVYTPDQYGHAKRAQVMTPSKPTFNPIRKVY